MGGLDGRRVIGRQFQRHGKTWIVGQHTHGPGHKRVLVLAVIVWTHPNLKLMLAAPALRGQHDGRLESARDLDAVAIDIAATDEACEPFAELLFEVDLIVAAPHWTPPLGLCMELTVDQFVQFLRHGWPRR